MGRAAKLKKIRKIAEKLPEVRYRSMFGERVQGLDIQDEMSDKEDFDIHATYKRKRVIEQSINHERKMKQAYDKFGPQGVVNYAAAIIKFSKQAQ